MRSGARGQKQAYHVEKLSERIGNVQPGMLGADAA
jgi:hypothetical protein